MSRKEIITEIICKKYGSSAATLIGVMFDADSLSIGDIYRNSRINPKHLRELMILFFKLDLIQEVPDKVNHFKLNEGNVMETTRIHLHLYYIKKAFGDVAESLAITLAINGMISKETCITETYAYLKLTEKHSLM